VTRASAAERAPKTKQVSAIIDAMSNAELTEYEAWSDLDALSTHTTIDGVDIDPAAIVITGNRFVGLAAIYVALQYGSNADDGFETSDSFEGQFEGHFEGAPPVIDKVTVDTSPFYE
jgi:hypothetical protein